MEGWGGWEQESNSHHPSSSSFCFNSQLVSVRQFSQWTSKTVDFIYPERVRSENRQVHPVVHLSSSQQLFQVSVLASASKKKKREERWGTREVESFHPRSHSPPTFQSDSKACVLCPGNDAQLRADKLADAVHFSQQET